MESTLQLEIVTPDKVVVSQTVDYVGVPGIEGEFGVLPHHIALLSAERGEDIATARANAAREREEARLAAKTAETDMLRAHLALQRAVERLHIASLV